MSLSGTSAFPAYDHSDFEMGDFEDLLRDILVKEADLAVKIQSANHIVKNTCLRKIKSLFF